MSYKKNSSIFIPEVMLEFISIGSYYNSSTFYSLSTKKLKYFLVNKNVKFKFSTK